MLRSAIREATHFNPGMEEVLMIAMLKRICIVLALLLAAFLLWVAVFTLYPWRSSWMPQKTGAGTAFVSNPEGATFHAAVRSHSYTEEWDIDTGGVVYCFVENEADKPDSIKSLRVNQEDISCVESVRWWRSWPESLPPGEIGTVTIKSTGAPIAQGADITLEVEMASGRVYSQPMRCVTPSLRIGNVLASQDRKQLFIYLRNDGIGPVAITGIDINAECFESGGARALSVAGGDAQCPPGELRICSVDYPESIPLLNPIAVRVSGDAGGIPVSVGASLRVTEPGFVLGTWSSDLPKDEAGMKYARELQLDATVNYTDWPRIEEMYRRFNISALSSANSGEPKQPDIEKVKQAIDQPYVYAWMVRDEPDLNGKPSSLMQEHNDQYWKADPSHPTYLNLMTTAAFNELGHIPDIACMDHYVMFAPNNIAWTTVFRHAEMEEALEFTLQLKENTEPRLMWTWCQLAKTGGWNGQPHPWGVDYQFWAHVMGGAKGILWFKYGPGYEEDYPEQVETARALAEQIAHIRTLCYYGESMDLVESGNPRVIARALVSEKALVVVALNSDYTVSGWPWRPVYRQYPVETDLKIKVPAWIAPSPVVSVTAEGFAPARYSLEKGMLTLPMRLESRSGVYVVGLDDKEAPEAPDHPHLACRDDAGITLSWGVPWDNAGVAGYEIQADGNTVTATKAPIITIAPELEGKSIRIRARDASGNWSPFAQVE